MANARGLIDYIWASPSPFHCVEESKRRLIEAGFVEMDEAATPSPVRSGSGGFVARSGTLIAWRAGSASPVEGGFRIVGAHTDSPNLRIKPNPESNKEHYVQWGVEPYGGVLLATWADRDLGLSGRVTIEKGAEFRTELLRIDRAIARIPNLAIHLNRKVNDEGLTLNKHKHLPPVVAIAGEKEEGNRLLNLLGTELGVDPETICGWDLGLHHTHKPTIGGLDDEFVFAPRLDNQASCYSALEALIAQTETPESTAVIALFDHEEVGSCSERGAASTLLRNTLCQLIRNHVAQAEGGIERATARSYMVSADMAHGVHPNYADLHDGLHKPVLNGGPVIKSNVNLRYSTDAETAARFRAACRAENVPYQEFVNRSDLACGSTIGPISSAALAIRSVDVGCAMLSMHSIREQAGAHDIDGMTRVMTRILSDT